MENLFDIPEAEYKLQRKVAKLRAKIKARTLELNIKTDHDDRGHFYLFGDKRFRSVTARLQILKDPALMNWKMNRALEYVENEMLSLEQNSKIFNIKEIIEQARLAPQLEFEGAGSIGSQIHEWREKWFSSVIELNESAQNFIGLTNGPLDSKDSPVISGCRAIQKFVEETKYEPLGCELPLADEKLETGGMGDDIGILDGQVGFMDVKSSNIADKDSYFYQVALYVAMFEKLYKIRTKWHKILHVSKVDGTYKLIDIPDIRKRIREAKQIIKVDKFLEDLRKEKKKQAIVI